MSPYYSGVLCVFAEMVRVKVCCSPKDGFVGPVSWLHGLCL